VVRSTVKPYVRRAYSAHQDFKTALLTMPRPFDQMLVCIRAPDLLVNDRRTNLRAEKLEEIRTLLARELPKLSAAAAGSSVAGAIDELRADLEATPSYSVDGGRKGIHPFVPEMLAFALPRRQPGEPDAVGELSDLSRSLDSIWTRIEGHVKDLPRRLAPDDGRRAPERKDLESIRRLVEGMREHQTRILDWQGRFSEYTGEARDDLESRFLYLEEPAISRKAFLTLSDTDPAGRPVDVTKELGLLMKRLGRLSGVILVRNPSRPLDLSRVKVRGKLVLGVTGEVVLSGTTLAGETDRLTVISYGRMSLEGRVHASLAALGDLEVSASGCELTGNLVVRRPAAGRLRPLTIRHDPLVQAGHGEAGQSVVENRAYYHVAMGPFIAGREVERSRADR
jgi:hypothetical protein